MSRAYRLIVITCLVITSLLFIGCNPKGAIISIVITPEKPSIDVEATQQFIATASYSNSNNEDISKQVTWASANTSIATIDTEGVATAISGGVTDISASLDGVNSATKLSICDPYQSIDSYNGSGDQIFIHSDFGGKCRVNYKLSLGSATANVFLISTVTSCCAGVARADINSNSLEFSPVNVETIELFEDIAPVIEFGLDEAIRFNTGVIKTTKYSDRLLSIASQPPDEPVLSVSVGDTNNFLHKSGNTTVTIPATARKVNSDGSTDFIVWVADDTWSGCSSGCTINKITQSMADEVANRFLLSGANNDIYDWLTTVFGTEWGSHSYSNLIGTTNAIHVLLYDIGDDDSTTGGTLGFFWSKDNYKRDNSNATLKTSNEKIMFYLDSVLLAEKDGSSWDASDSWPQILFSTIAHEFQHVIHFYQKQVIRSGTGETWLNEMVSMIAQDLIAEKMAVIGPRGITYNDPSAGTANTTMGRLPKYNANNYIRVSEWSHSSRYEIAYAFGAYLARTYGSEFVGKIVKTSKDGTDAIVEAQGSTVTFGEMLTNWAIANLLSDNTSAASPYQYNTNTWLSSSTGGTSYKLGSINLFNYKYGSQVGPKTFSLSNFATDSTKQDSHTNYYIAAGQKTGDVIITMDVPDGNTITIVVKE